MTKKTSPYLLDLIRNQKGVASLFIKLALFKMFPLHVQSKEFLSKVTQTRTILKSPAFLPAEDILVTKDRNYYLVRFPLIKIDHAFYSHVSWIAHASVAKYALKNNVNLYPDAHLYPEAIHGIDDTSDLVLDIKGSFPNLEVDHDVQMPCSALPIKDAELFSFPFSVPGIVHSLELKEEEVALTLKVQEQELVEILGVGRQQIRLYDVWEYFRYLSAHTYRYGISARPETKYVPLSKMREDNKGKPERDLLGLLVSNEGSPLYLPKKVDNVFEYEDYLVNNNASTVGYKGRNKSKQRYKIIYTDFVNEKLIYTTGYGNLAHIDLAMYQKVNKSQMYRLLTNSMEFATVLGTFSSWGNEYGVELNKDNISLTGKLEFEFEGEKETAYLPSTKKGEELLSLAGVLSRRTKKQITFAHLLDSEQVIFSAIREYLLKLAALVDNRVIGRGGIPHSLKCLAILKIFSLLPTAQEEPKPGNSTPALPLVAKGLGRLPHQVKVTKALSNMPKLASLPVQAGGGKTPLGIFDILLTMDSHNGRIAVMCPSQLVAQYISENNYFTQGKLNIIPVTSEAIRNHTLEGLIDKIRQVPRNTFVVIDIDSLKYQAETFVYAGTEVVMYPVAQALKSCNFAYVLIDESHYLANLGSQRTQSCSVFVNTITKYKRIASGTINFDSPSDLPSQYALLDPTLLFDVESFNEKYGEMFTGTRVLKWKGKAPKEIESKIKTAVLVAGAQRKEWAALLPNSHEYIHRVQLTDNQRRVYDILLNYAIDEIKKNPSVLKRIEEDEDADIGDLLNPYLSRLEQFVAAPARDELGALELTGEDLIPPKLPKIEEIIKEHLKTTKGKILVFTNHRAVAEEIYQRLSPSLKSQAILYEAENKHRCRYLFDNDANKQIMIGVGISLYTGLNLQEGSRVIRVETVWSPGLIEQGESRVKRPQLKKEETRDKIYFDTIAVDRTIDITKLSRLISKIVTVERFDNQHNPKYLEVPEVEVLKMTLDNIIANNDWDTSLAQYAEVFSKLRKIQNEEYEEYKQEFLATYKGEILSPVERRKAKNVYFNTNLVFTRGMSLPYQDELGLTLVSNFDGVLTNQRVLTDKGLGRVVRENKNTVRVQLRHKTTSFDKQSCFVVPPKFKLEDLIDKVKLKPYKPKEVIKPKVRKIKSRLSFKRTKANHYLGLEAIGNQTLDNLLYLQKEGFKLANTLYVKEVKSKEEVEAALLEVTNLGLSNAPGTKEDFDALTTFFEKKPTAKRSARYKLKNPLVMEFKGTLNTLHLYVLIENNKTYLVTNNPKVKTLKWKFRRRRFVKFGPKEKLKSYK